MTIIPRTQFGNPILRHKAKRVPGALIGKPGFRTLIAQMFRTMHAADGVGLAASQIGLALQLAVIEVESGTGKRKKKGTRTASERIVLINPKLLKVSKGKSYDFEGCLSLDGVRGKVLRHKKVTVQYTDEGGVTHMRTTSGFLARVFQHEIDHLHGTLYVDRMEDMKTLTTVGELLKKA